MDYDLNYYLFDPTGNITALVETAVPARDQKAVAAELMKLEPSVEQVGFISAGSQGCDISLRMAGGEFCGNAAMCCAVLTGREKADIYIEGTGRVSAGFSGDEGSVMMPHPADVTTVRGWPLVRFSGISHIVVDGPPFPDSEEKIVSWCGILGCDALGIMFVEGRRLTPLVYVKTSETLFWETSCASGTTAAGIIHGGNCVFTEPGGVLSYSDGFLRGNVKLIKKSSAHVTF